MNEMEWSVLARLPGAAVCLLFDLPGWQTRRGTSRAVIPLKPKYGLTPISCHAVLERSACAPFIKERRMECINAASLRRKSGQVGHPAVWCDSSEGIAIEPHS
jgi:hypothetical protein